MAALVTAGIAIVGIAALRAATRHIPFTESLLSTATHPVCLAIAPMVVLTPLITWLVRGYVEREWLHANSPIVSDLADAIAGGALVGEVGGWQQASDLARAALGANAPVEPLIQAALPRAYLRLWARDQAAGPARQSAADVLKQLMAAHPPMHLPTGGDVRLEQRAGALGQPMQTLGRPHPSPWRARVIALVVVLAFYGLLLVLWAIASSLLAMWRF